MGGSWQPDSLRESDAPLFSLFAARRIEREKPPGSDELLNRSQSHPFAVHERARTESINSLTS